MSELWWAFGWSGIGVMVLVHVAYGLAVYLNRNDVADVFWGLGFIVVAVITGLLGAGGSLPVLVTGLVVVWGVRLATHIWMRNKGKKEDFRYNQWREEWGDNWRWRSYLQVFLLQGMLLLVISLPVVIGNTVGGSIDGLWGGLGVLVWIVGFVFESVGDYQLQEFKKQPKDKRPKILATGLWRYTRHPNYFGEICMWWGVWLVSMSVGYGIWGVAGPAVITYLIVFVSGVPLLEKKYEGNPEYEAYKKQVSVLIPWFVGK